MERAGGGGQKRSHTGSPTNQVLKTGVYNVYVLDIRGSDNGESNVFAGPYLPKNANNASLVIFHYKDSNVKVCNNT